MEKIISLLVIIPFMIFFIGCNQHSSSKRSNTNVNEITSEDSLSNDTSAYVIELSTLSDVDFWLKNNNIKKVSGTVKRLTDAYNAAVVMNSLITDFDLQMRFDFEYDNVVTAIENINLTFIKDTETLSKIYKYKQELLYLLHCNPDTINQNIHNPWKAKEDLYVYLSEKYHLSTFGDLDVDYLVEKYNNCPSIPEWKELIKKRGNKNMVSEFEEKYKRAKDFDARCIYSIELAHAYEADLDSWTDEDYRNPALIKMESLMREEQFSLYLFDLWQTWRVLYQDSEGASKDSEIPNHIYNEYRKLCANTTLTYIERHPKDLSAINTFLLLAYEENILREGEYPYGNQYIIDKVNLFSEKYTNNH